MSLYVFEFMVLRYFPLHFIVGPHPDETRKLSRETSKYEGGVIVRSLQSCQTLEPNLSILNRYLDILTTGSFFHNKIKALRDLFIHLTSLQPDLSSDDSLIMRSFMSFQEAYEIYNSFF